MTIDRSITERRCSPRLPISLPAQMNRQDLQTVNLGCLGVFLEHTEKRAVGEPLQFFVTLPDSDGAGKELLVECHGVVIHCDGCESRDGLGVRIHGAWLVGAQDEENLAGEA